MEQEAPIIQLDCGAWTAWRDDSTKPELPYAVGWAYQRVAVYRFPNRDVALDFLMLKKRNQEQLDKRLIRTAYAINDLRPE